MTAAWFVVAAGLGAASRHGVNRLGHGTAGTIVINVAGSFTLGWLLAGDPSDGAQTVIAAGFLGSFTTFSTFALEAVEATRARRVVIVAVTVAAGIAAAALGHTIG